jgi:hypothetical protein
MAREHYGFPLFEAHMPVNRYVETCRKSAQGGEEQAASLSTVVYFAVP